MKSSRILSRVSGLNMRNYLLLSSKSWTQCMLKSVERCTHSILISTYLMRLTIGYLLKVSKHFSLNISMTKQVRYLSSNTPKNIHLILLIFKLILLQRILRKSSLFSLKAKNTYMKPTRISIMNVTTSSDIYFFLFHLIYKFK